MNEHSHLSNFQVLYQQPTYQIFSKLQFNRLVLLVKALQSALKLLGVQKKVLSIKSSAKGKMQ